MKTTKTLALAALAALSLGMGSALAQEGGENAYASASVRYPSAAIASQCSR